jgi:Uma2 family endonuclease
MTTTSTTASATPRELGLDDVRRELFDASDRIERTEQGWVEKVTTKGHGNVQTHLTARMLALGLDPETIAWGVRLTKEPSGQWYVPDGIVVRAGNPVPGDPEAIYGGIPDLAIEILSGNPQTAAGRAERERDLVEKRRAYAARGIPHYWIVEPRTRNVTWLVLDPASGAYEGRWEGPLAEVPSPWESGGGEGPHGGE